MNSEFGIRNVAHLLPEFRTWEPLAEFKINCVLRRTKQDQDVRAGRPHHKNRDAGIVVQASRLHVRPGRPHHKGSGPCCRACPGVLLVLSDSGGGGMCAALSETPVSVWHPLLGQENQPGSAGTRHHLRGPPQAVDRTGSVVGALNVCRRRLAQDH